MNNASLSNHVQVFLRTLLHFSWVYESESLVTQLYPAFCDPMNYSSPGSSVHAILQARTLEWVAIPFS